VEVRTWGTYIVTQIHTYIHTYDLLDALSALIEQPASCSILILYQRCGKCRETGHDERRCPLARGGGGGGEKSPDLKRSIDINKQILGARCASELCTLVKTSVAEFNHVNVSTAFRTLLQGRHDGGLRGVVQHALQTLEAAARRTIDSFQAQEVANILHIIAKTRYSPMDQSLVPQLEGRAEAVCWTFKSQDVANTLWAYATMGLAPGALLLKALEGRAEALAGTFKAQEVANTLWAYATMRQEPGVGLLKALEERAEALVGTFKAQDVTQLEVWRRFAPQIVEKKSAAPTLSPKSKRQIESGELFDQEYGVDAKRIATLAAVLSSCAVPPHHKQQQARYVYIYMHM